MPDENMTALFAGVVGVVEAERYEHLMLWAENQRRDEPRVWKENLSGRGATVGRLGDMPVCISLLTAEVDGQKLLFMHPTSVVVDHAMIERWLERHLPWTAFWADGRLNRVDASNFHNVFRPPADHGASVLPLQAADSAPAPDDLPKPPTTYAKGTGHE